MTEFRAGAASLRLEPPLGLPMVGFVRQPWNARGYGLPLEVGALVLERGDTRVVLCGVDVVGIIHPQIEPLIDRIAAATGAGPEGVLLNLSHTHLAPPGGVANGAVYGDVDDEVAASIEAFSRVLHDKIVSACALAAGALEPAGIVWGQADVDLAVNRRERTTDGFNGGSILGWNPDELVDNQVTVLQVRRPDESAIATLVGLRLPPRHDRLRHGRLLGGLPRPHARRRARRLGRRVHLLPGRRRERPAEVRLHGHGGRGAPHGDAARARGARGGRGPVQPGRDRRPRGRGLGDAHHPLSPPASWRPTRRRHWPPRARRCPSRCCRIPRSRRSSASAVSTTTRSRRRARRATEDVSRSPTTRRPGRGGSSRSSATAPRRRSVRGPVHAVRVGDGVIVTGPGETFTEYGIAVKERSPGRPTLYAGYTNEILGYLPTANEYQYGGLRGRLRVQERRPALALRPGRRADPRRDGRPARRASVPRGRAVGRRGGLARPRRGAEAARGSARAPVAAAAEVVP